MTKYISSLKINLIIISLVITSIGLSQNDIESKEFNLSGNINVSNNGFSLIPLFSLGEPATVIDLSFGNDRLSFDPSFSFELNGLKPWILDFRWNYKIIKQEKYLVNLGLFLPGLFFRNTTFEKNGDQLEGVFIWRSIVSTLNLSYSFSDKFSLGIFYFRPFPIEQIDPNQPRRGSVLSIKSSLRNLKISESIKINWNPELYFPKIDEKSGIFVAQNILIEFKNFPLSISSNMNKAIDFGNFTGKEFDWNVGINYSFNNTFAKKKKNQDF